MQASMHENIRKFWSFMTCMECMYSKDNSCILLILVVARHGGVDSSQKIKPDKIGDNGGNGTATF